MSKEKIIVGHRAAAAYVGLKVGTWTGYVSRGHAPRPDLPPTIRGGNALPTYRASTLDEWMTNRPGPGARTDLRRQRDE